MQRSLIFLGLSVLVTAGSLWAGCLGSSTSAAGTGGTSASSSVAAGGALGMGGNISCNDDGICQLSNGEDCTCSDCEVTAYCNPGQCTDTTSCDHMLDSCTCAGCAEDAYCGDPTLGNCQDGGACDPYIEGCHCPDCWTYTECTASVAACAGGKPDGVCDRATEDCSCVDCQGTPLCVPCMNLGQCVDGEPCDCADCVLTSLCNDPVRCVDDGVCAILSEGCVCNDCKDLPECTQWLDGGTDGGPEGGTDAGDDGGTDGGTDAGGDGGPDGGTDAGSDGGP